MKTTKILLTWYFNNKRNLPWRETKNPYKIWLSEIILQQTQVAQGLSYYEKFVAHYPTVTLLAEAPEIEVLNLWQGLGYYARARNLHQTAQIIAREKQGIFPDNYPELIKLRGIGDYTASAIASICFNRPTPVVDGNVYRFLARYFGVETPINASSAKKEFKALAQSLMDHTQPGDFNQAIMEFGARQCKPQNPDCTICPLNNSCSALAKNLVRDLPVKIKINKMKNRYFNYLVFVSDDGKTLLEQRTEKDIWEGLYQFPLVETNRKVGPQTLLKSDVFKHLTAGKEYDISAFQSDYHTHRLSHQLLYIKFWILRLASLDNGIPSTELDNYPVPISVHRFMEAFEF